MSTMDIFANNYNVVYVDTKIISAGSGITPSTAMDNLPLPTDMVDETVYLCRRYDDNLGVYQQTISNENTGNMNAIFVLGMPISGDGILYDNTPTEAISAWGNDTSEYFRFYATNHNIFWRFTNIKNFGMHRVQLEHKQNANNVINVFEISGINDNIGLGFITNCKFINRESTGINLIELDNINYNTNTNFNPATNYINGFNYFSFKNNKIISSNDYFSFNNAINHITFDTIKNLYYEDNELYISSQSMSTQAAVQFRIIDKLTIKRINIKYIAQDTNIIQFTHILDISSVSYVIVDDIFVTDFRYYRIDPLTHTLGSIGSVIGITLANSTNGGSSCILKNINILLNYIRGFNHEVISVNSVTVNSIQDPVNLMESVIDNISLSTPISGGIASASLSNYGMNINIKALTMSNLNISVPFGNAISATNVKLIKNLNVEGICAFSSCDFVEINNFRFRGNPTILIRSHTSFIYLKNMIIDNNATWGSVNWLEMVNNQSSSINLSQKVIINNTELPLLINWVKKPGQTSGVWANNVNGQTGNWIGDNYHYIGQTWNVTRINGGTASIKFSKGSQATIENPNALWIAPPTFRGLEWTPISISNHTLKVYVAFKNFTNASELSEKFHVQLEVPEINNGVPSTKLYQSYIDGSWQTDTVSTWINDSGLTQKVLIMPFNVTLLQAVTVRMRFQWYDATGYLYVDPQIEFI